MPVIQKVRESGLDFLEGKEAEAIDHICSDYKMILDEIHTFLLGRVDIRFGGEYSKEERALIDWLPEEIKEKLDKALLNELAIKAWEDDLYRIAEQIIAIGDLPLEFMGVELKPVAEFTDDDEKLDEQMGEDSDDELSSNKDSSTQDHSGRGSTDEGYANEEYEGSEAETFENDEMKMSEEEKDYLRKMECSIAARSISDAVEDIDYELSALSKIVKHEYGYGLEYIWKAHNIEKYGKRKKATDKKYV